MDKNTRIVGAALAAAAGLFLAGCDNAEPEEPAAEEEVVEEDVPENEMAESEMASDPGAGETGTAEDAPTAADAEDMMPEGDPGEAAMDPEAAAGG
jgi:hypothetical protein